MADLRQYEVMVILDPDLDERTVAPSLDTYLNVVRQSGGTVETDSQRIPIVAVSAQQAPRAVRNARPQTQAVERPLRWCTEPCEHYKEGTDR